MKEKKKRQRKIPFRINVLFFVVFLLFSILVIRLGIVQIVYGEDFTRELKRTNEVTVGTSVPRGRILDRNGNLMVGNQSLNTITYVKSNSTSQQEILDIAEKLAKLIKKDTKEDIDSITERDRKDFWILKNPEQAKAKLTKSELYNEKLDNQDKYQLQLDRITEREMNSFSKDELEVLAIWRTMVGGYALTPQIVKNKGVTNEEYAIVSEHLSELPGVDTTTDWERYNLYKNKDGSSVLGSVLGKVTSSKEGLPKEMSDFYLAQGYSRNDRVGKSYLEYQYESVLRGTKEKVKTVTDQSDNIIGTETITPGNRGDDLVLSIDMDLQLKAEEILKKKLDAVRPSQQYMDRAFVTVINPRTGELLAMAGKQYIKDEDTGKTDIADFALGNMNTAYSMGSVVKGATLLTGYQTGAIHPGDIQYDRTLSFKGTQDKKSWKVGGFGPISDQYALTVSSNVYMFLTAMKIGGQQTYVPNGPLSIDKVAAIKKLRYNFSQFGLGVKTGIDLPGEQTGIGGDAIPQDAGKVLDFAIGQYDTYTPLQLAQYISTIANGGYRIQPHIVKEIRNPDTDPNKMGSIKQNIDTVILNKLDMKSEWIKRVQSGMQSVVYSPDGTANDYIKNKKYKIAGKTGTAQALYAGPKVQDFLDRDQPLPMLWNVTFVGYAPYDNPEIALSVVVPWSTTDKTHTNIEIADEIFKTYFELKEKRAKQGIQVNNPLEAEVIQNK